MINILKVLALPEAANFELVRNEKRDFDLNQGSLDRVLKVLDVAHLLEIKFPIKQVHCNCKADDTVHEIFFKP